MIKKIAFAVFVSALLISCTGKSNVFIDWHINFSEPCHAREDYPLQDEQCALIDSVCQVVANEQKLNFRGGRTIMLNTKEANEGQELCSRFADEVNRRILETGMMQQEDTTTYSCVLYIFSTQNSYKSCQKCEIHYIINEKFYYYSRLKEQ